MQQKWRIAGGLCLVGCVLMVVFSGTVVRPGISRLVLLVYWGSFLLLLMGALWAALLDLRFTRMEFKLHERALFRDTFMTEEFRKALADAQRQKHDASKSSEEG